MAPEPVNMCPSEQNTILPMARLIFDRINWNTSYFVDHEEVFRRVKIAPDKY